MASNISNTPTTGSMTETIIRNAEERTPHPTLRLKMPSRNPIKVLADKITGDQKEETDDEAFQEECENAKAQILEDIKTVITALF